MTDRPLRSALLAILLGGCTHPPLVTRPANPPARLLIRDVTVLEVDSGQRQAHRDVLIERDRIASVRETSGEPPPADLQVISGAGAALLPGLIDAHVHLYQAQGPPWIRSQPDLERNLQAFLYCGVATVLDAADLTPRVFHWRDGVEKGTLLGPRIFAAGPAFTAPGGHPAAMLNGLLPRIFAWYVRPRLTRQIATPEEGTRAVEALAPLHPDVIKVIADEIPEGVPRLDEPRIAAIAAAAKAHGIRAVAHVGTSADALLAARAGVGAWMHVPYREHIPDGAIAEMAGFRIPLVATMVVFDSYGTLGWEPRRATPLEKEIAEPELLASFDPVPVDDPRVKTFASFLQDVRAHRQDLRANVGRLKAAGVTIIAGSDCQPGVFPGAGLHRELSLLVEAGLTPGEAIRAATSDAARFVSGKEDPEFGTVAPGKKADLVLVEGDPLSDLSALSRIRSVIVGGVPLDRHPVSQKE